MIVEQAPGPLSVFLQERGLCAADLAAIADADETFVASPLGLDEWLPGDVPPREAAS